MTPMEERVRELRAQARSQDPHITARNAGAKVVQGATGAVTLELRLWETYYHIAWPEVQAVVVASGQPCQQNTEANLLYYLCTADGTPLTGQWVGFQELPEGTYYNRAFQGYSGDELVRHFEEDVESFRRAAKLAGGALLSFSDAGFSYLPLPRVPLAVVYWLGEEGIPTKAQVIFDKASGHYLPTDALAGMGAQLVHRIMRADGRGDPVA